MAGKELQTRDQILAAAKEEFLERGYRGASLRDIAARAQLTTGALYGCFKDKADLFEQVISPLRDDIIKEWIAVTEKPEYNPKSEEAQNTDIFDRECALYRDFVGIIMRHPEEMRLLVVAAEGSPSDGFFRQLSELGMLGAVDFMVHSSGETTLSEVGVHRSLKRILSTPVQQFFAWIVKEDIDQEEAEKSCELLLRFTLSGWRSLLILKK